MKKTLVAAALLLAAAALPAGAQARVDLRPDQPMRLEVPSLWPETLRASFVRLDTAGLHVVTHRSRGDTVAIPLDLVQRAEVRTDSLPAAASRRRGVTRGARNGFLVGASFVALWTGVGVVTGGTDDAGDFLTDVGLPLTAITTGSGALFGLTFGASEVWTPVDLRPEERAAALEAAASSRE